MGIVETRTTGRVGRPLITRRRFQVAVAVVLAAVLPFILRYIFAQHPVLSTTRLENSLIANTIAVVLAFWMRLSVEPYPGIRSGSVILPVALAAHGTIFTAFILANIPGDRVSLFLGFLFNLVWNYAVYLLGEHRIRSRIAVVPFGDTQALTSIGTVDWATIGRPKMAALPPCNAIVADFSAELPDEWESFLADAALSGLLVYQVKQLSESLTGRVELGHLSENSFGSLLPARGYFHLKTVADILAALIALPVLLPVMGAAAIAIAVEGGGPILFRQTRIGHAGRPFRVIKFRTMNFSAPAGDDDRSAAMTLAKDPRITRVGAFLRRTRIDELPQIFNILRAEMSWIGPRPEAAVLSSWYLKEIPFYRYRHVVKPGISGWAQVNQGHVAEVDEVHRKLQYDFYYIKYFSPWLDVLIVFKTIKTMLFGFGAR